MNYIAPYDITNKSTMIIAQVAANKGPRVDAWLYQVKIEHIIYINKNIFKNININRAVEELEADVYSEKDMLDERHLIKQLFHAGAQ